MIHIQEIDFLHNSKLKIIIILEMKIFLLEFNQSWTAAVSLSVNLVVQSQVHL